ncbi:MAG: ankyrin repeat domain-containing protein [Kurthia sp.]|nr:ankyrin repeat domain-containing protein [Candidatus Kurthia equi]
MINKDATTKWFEAVEKSDRYSMKKLLKNDFNINRKNDKGQTALMLATYNNDIKLVEFLVTHEADVNAQDATLNSPFLYAAAEGYLDILKLIGHRGDVKRINRFGGIGIIPASERAHLETLKWLLENTASDVNHVNHMGWTALLEAIILGDGSEKYVKTVRLLLKHGASPEIADRDGVTPFEHAEKLGYIKILKLLKS